MSKQKTKKKTGTEAKPISESAKANTVNGKRALYQSAAKEMLQSGINTLQAGIREMQAGIGEQRKKYAEGAVAFQSGVDEMLSNIAKHAQDNQAYIKQFIG